VINAGTLKVQSRDVSGLVKAIASSCKAKATYRRVRSGDTDIIFFSFRFVAVPIRCFNVPSWLASATSSRLGIQKISIVWTSRMDGVFCIRWSSLSWAEIIA